MVYIINKTEYEVDNIIYVRNYGNNNNSGSIDSPLLSIQTAVRKSKSSEYTVIDVGEGIFVFTQYHNSEGILVDEGKPIIFIGKGEKTILVLNQLASRPTYESRHYKIQLINSKTILTNFVIDINFPNPSGSSWGPNVWNPLFTWCRGTICNNIFRIKTTTMGMGYYNDSWGVPNIYNNVFAGSYNLDGDYSGYPIYVNNLFINIPSNGSDSYYSKLSSDINTDIMNGNFGTLLELQILGSPNISNVNGSQSILGPYGGPLAILIPKDLYTVKINDKFVIPSKQYYDHTTNEFSYFTLLQVLEKAKSGEKNFLFNLFDKFTVDSIIVNPQNIINFKECNIVVFSEESYKKINIKYNLNDGILGNAKLSYFYNNINDYKDFLSTAEPYNSLYKNINCNFIYELDNKESVISEINIFIKSDIYRKLNENDINIYKYNENNYVKFINDYNNVIVNKIIKEKMTYSKDSLDIF